jgi:hypothetical protein
MYLNHQVLSDTLSECMHLLNIFKMYDKMKEKEDMYIVRVFGNCADA